VIVLQQTYELIDQWWFHAYLAYKASAASGPCHFGLRESAQKESSAL